MALHGCDSQQLSADEFLLCFQRRLMTALQCLFFLQRAFGGSVKESLWVQVASVPPGAATEAVGFQPHFPGNTRLALLSQRALLAGLKMTNYPT